MRELGYNAGNARGRLNISQAVGLSARLKVNWKKVLRCKAKVSATVAKLLVNSNFIVVLKRSKEPNIKRLQKMCWVGRKAKQSHIV